MRLIIAIFVFFANAQPPAPLFTSLALVLNDFGD
jgi:hypothetical protein